MSTADMISPTSFADLCRSELELCRVRPGETLVVLSQGYERQEYVDAFLAAGQQLGATALHLRLPYSSSATAGEVGVWTVGQTPLRGNQPALEILKQADIVVETLFVLFSPELVEIQEAGTRILTCIEPVDVLARLFPTQELRRQVDAAAELLRAASTLRFTNHAGTDVTYRLGAYPVQTQYGFADTPGRWDHWPSAGMLTTGGADDGVDGRVIVAPGDILLPFKVYAQAPVEFTIEAGRISAIEGGVEADIVREYMANFDDPDAYGISHIGWGLDGRAKWTALATDKRGHGMELRAFRGNVLFSTGPNQQFGGPNHTACHLDIPMRNCSLYLDDAAVIVDGQVVEQSLLQIEPVAL
jgi:2,5-dihydroxypyridine 5,6-dioxygenase